MVGILGKKLGMTQLFQADGTWVPVTVVQAGPCKVLQVKVNDTSPSCRKITVTRSTNHGKKRGKHARAAAAPTATTRCSSASRTRPTRPPRSARRRGTRRAPTRRPSVFVRELRYDAHAALQARRRGQGRRPQGRQGHVDGDRHHQGPRLRRARSSAGVSPARRRRTATASTTASRVASAAPTRRTTACPKKKKMCGHYGVELPDRAEPRGRQDRRGAQLGVHPRCRPRPPLVAT